MAKRSAAAHIRQLTRRHDTLAARVGTGRGQSETWDRAELSALEWALPILKERSPAFGGRAPSPGAHRDPQRDTKYPDSDEPEGACLDDPDGMHHVGCGCP